MSGQATGTRAQASRWGRAYPTPPTPTGSAGPSPLLMGVCSGLLNPSSRSLHETPHCPGHCPMRRWQNPSPRWDFLPLSPLRGHGEAPGLPPGPGSCTPPTPPLSCSACLALQDSTPVPGGLSRPRFKLAVLLACSHSRHTPLPSAGLWLPPGSSGAAGSHVCHTL